jgi:antitoxin PrlF
MNTKPTEEIAATVSSKGQVVIPADVRRRLGLAQGSVLRFVIDADGVHLRAAAGSVQRLKGRLAPPPAPVSVDDMNRAIAERRADIAARRAARRPR